MAYTITFTVFSVIQAYTMVLALYLVSNTSGLAYHTVLSEKTIQTAHLTDLCAAMVLAGLISTFGAHVVASMLYMDPWHVFISSWAYFVGMSCNSNILMVYAFCNWHDVVLGVQSTEKVNALPQALALQHEESKFIEEVDRPQVDIDTRFSETVKLALAPIEKAQEAEELSLEDSYKSFRTYLILLWVSSNILLVLCINSVDATKLCFTVYTPFELCGLRFVEMLTNF